MPCQIFDESHEDCNVSMNTAQQSVRLLFRLSAGLQCPTFCPLATPRRCG